MKHFTEPLRILECRGASFDRTVKLAFQRLDVIASRLGGVGVDALELGEQRRVVLRRNVHSRRHLRQISFNAAIFFTQHDDFPVDLVDAFLHDVFIVERVRERRPRIVELALHRGDCFAFHLARVPLYFV